MAERGSLDQLPASTLGQYKIRSKLGSGGMGDVYDAVHTSLDKRVAIKTLRRRFLEDEVVVARFLREGQLAARMRHPNIVDITDVGMIDGMPCLVMEHLEGETLSELIKRGPGLAPSALVDLLLPIVAAVDFAHERGILHRDLKPSNIFLARSWNGEVTPKVLDFGISKLVSESTEAALTTDSAFIGTPHYASPESMRAEKTADRRADLYSMGVILYEGITGVRPFKEQGSNFVSMAMAICSGEYPPLATVKPEAPEPYVKVVERAMALRAADRYPTMRHLGQALLPFASERLRMIWAPAFKTDDATAAIVAPPPETSVLHAQNMTAVIPHPMSGSGPVMQRSQSWSSSSQPSHPPSGPGSGPISQHNPMHAHPPTPPSMSGFSGGQYASFPAGPASHDRTPSFGAGTGTPFSAAPRPKSSAMLYVSIGVVAMGLAIVGGVVVSKQRGTPAAEPGATTALAGDFSIDVRTTPENAIVEIDGAAAGTGHVVRSFPRDKQSHVLRVSAPNHETLLTQFDDQRPPPTLIVLRATAAPTIIAAPGASTTAPPQRPPVVNTPPPAQNKGGPKGKTDRPRTDNIDPWE